MPWIDGAFWMLRSEAVREVGLLDEQFFLFSEEVDWCIRAGYKGWRVGVLRDSEVRHERSSSFGDSTKGAYYAWRNSFLLCKKHEGYGGWIYFWFRSLLQFAAQRGHIRSGMASAALRGARDAIAGRTGRMNGDE
jgi:GT2 family glycosyltransferase